MGDIKPPSSQNEKDHKKKVKITSKNSVWWILPVKIFFLSIALSLIFSIGSEFIMSATGIILSTIIIFF